MKKIVMASALLLILTACNGGKDRNSMMTMLNSKWVLLSLTGQSDINTIYNGRIPVLNFDTESLRVAGNTGCNNFNGPFSVESEGKLNFGNLAMTKMACPGNGESLFTAALSQVTGFRINDNILVLLNGDNQVMEFGKSR